MAGAATPVRASFGPLKQGLHERETGLSKQDGMLVLVSSIFIFCSFFIWIAIVKMMPPTNYGIIEWMREDDYYVFLVPLTFVPVALVANYLAWFSASTFQTNEW